MWSRTAVFVAFASLAACASGGKETFSGRPDAHGGGGGGQDSGGGGGGDDDAASPVKHDAATPDIDAEPSGAGHHDLTGTNSPDDNGKAIACSASNALGDTLYTDQNSYYRVYPMSQFGIHSTFHVTNVSFPIEDVEPAAVTLSIKIGTYSGTPGNTLDTGSITSLATKSHSAANAATSASVDIAGDVPAGGTLVVQVDAPSGKTGNKFFYIGTNDGGETTPSYISSTATDCGAETPTKVTSAAGSETDLIINVSGDAD